MADKEWNPQAMDKAAADAQNDLVEEGAPSEEALIAVANWWKKWFGKAGHKRLGRILLEYSTTISSNNNNIALDPKTGKFSQVAAE